MVISRPCLLSHVINHLGQIRRMTAKFPMGASISFPNNFMSVISSSMFWLEYFLQIFHFRRKRWYVLHREKKRQSGKWKEMGEIKLCSIFQLWAMAKVEDASRWFKGTICNFFWIEFLFRENLSNWSLVSTVNLILVSHIGQTAVRRIFLVNALSSAGLSILRR